MELMEDYITLSSKKKIKYIKSIIYSSRSSISSMIVFFRKLH